MKCQLCKLSARLVRYEHHNSVTKLPKIYRLCLPCVRAAQQSARLWAGKSF